MTRRVLRRDTATAALPAAAANLHPAVRRVYAARGVRNDDQLDLGLDRLLPVGTLGGVDAAAELLADCHRRGRRVLVIGDFDADGATSTALMLRQMRRLGFVDAAYLVPDRFRYGYGLTPGIVEVAASMRPDLIVTVDNGISSLDGVESANRVGIQVLVTDHHLPGAQLPAAAAIVNPNLPGERFASKSLAGLGARNRAFASAGSTPSAVRPIERPPTGATPAAFATSATGAPAVIFAASASAAASAALRAPWRRSAASTSPRTSSSGRCAEGL